MEPVTLIESLEVNALSVKSNLIDNDNNAPYALMSSAKEYQFVFDLIPFYLHPGYFFQDTDRYFWVVDYVLASNMVTGNNVVAGSSYMATGSRYMAIAGYLSTDASYLSMADYISAGSSYMVVGGSYMSTGFQGQTERSMKAFTNHDRFQFGTYGTQLISGHETGDLLLKETTADVIDTNTTAVLPSLKTSADLFVVQTEYLKRESQPVLQAGHLQKNDVIQKVMDYFNRIYRSIIKKLSGN
jgi:hypothetical protein